MGGGGGGKRCDAHVDCEIRHLDCISAFALPHGRGGGCKID